MRAFAYDIHRFYPPDYFKKSQAALIRLHYPYNVYADIIAQSGHDLNGIAMSTQLVNNAFSDNLNVQVITYHSLRYKASLLEYSCGIAQARILIQGNTVKRTQFSGSEAAFFYINGGIASVFDNTFAYNGYLTKKVNKNTVATYQRQFEHSLFPWEDYEEIESQDRGIFWFDFNDLEMPLGFSHDLQNNTFEHIYCQQGCAYYVTGTQIQQFTFKQNTYFVMVGSKGAAVFYGNVNLPASNKQAQVWIQVYIEERFEKIFGGSIQLSGNNVPITIIGKSNFINNFGARGAALSLIRGGGIYVKDSSFYLESKLSSQNTELDTDTQEGSIEYNNRIYEEAWLEIYTTYADRLAQKYLFDRELFDEMKQTQNEKGQVYLKNSFNTILNDQQPVYAYQKMKLQGLIYKFFDLNFLETSFSSLRNPRFQNNLGVIASTIYIDRSKLQLIGTDSDINFDQNVAPYGQTIYMTFSKIEAFRMYFAGNRGLQGACYLLDSDSVLLDVQSVYSNNYAMQGGVIYIINDSSFKFIDGTFEKNNAQDGAVVYSMYNSYERALSFSNCNFIENSAIQNLMQLMSSKAFIENSYFSDNSAQVSNHGINLITSTTEVFNTTITFSENFADNLNLEKLSCGFFSLFLGSHLELGQNTMISNLKAQDQAVLCAFSYSSLSVSKDVQFINNQALSPSGQTMSMQNTGAVEISDAHFEGNKQTNLHVELGTIIVQDSTFTNGEANHVSGLDSQVTFRNVSMYDSQSSGIHGHGFICTRCTFVGIENSRFENLISFQGFGGAMSIHDLDNKAGHASYIINSEFVHNQALNGGAIQIDRANKLQISGNRFEKNFAGRSKANSLDVNGLGGAILYMCDPIEINYTCNVSLRNNTFIENEASNKGGALRYENTNFTDGELLLGEEGRRLQETDVLANTLEAEVVEPVVQSFANVFDRNEAPYGADFGSFPEKIEYTVPENDSGAKINVTDFTLTLAAGQKFELQMEIIDREGRIYTGENNAIAKIEFEQGQQLGPGALMLGTDAVAKQGRFTFNSFIVRIKPNTSAKVVIKFRGMEHFGTRIEFLDSPPVFTVLARQCTEGEQYTEDLSCIPCPSQFFLYEAQEKPGQCQDCNPNAYCYGMNNTAPKPGYWRSRPKLEEYTPCTRPESCLGGNVTDAIGQCEIGYKGILCSDCASGFSRSGQDCNECPDFAWNIIIFIALLIVLILVIAFLVKSTLGGVEVKKPLYQVLLKIFLNHFQILAAVSQINFKWPALIQTVLNSQQGVADGPTKILSVDCLLMDMFPGGKPTMRLNYVRLIMFTCMPFIIQFSSWAFWAVYGRCKHIHEKERSDKGTATAIIVLFLFYPTIVSIIAKSVNCVEIEGERRLFDDMEELCFTGTHLLMVLCVSVPGLVAWAFGIPIYALIKLFRNVAALEEIKQRAAGQQHEDLLRSFKVRLGFLTAGYDDKYFYWEIVLLMRKSLLVLMIVFLSSVSSGVQSLTSILVLTCFMVVQWRHEPYYDKQLNDMETLSLTVIIITIYFGLYYQAGEGEPIMQNDVVTWIIFVLVLVPSISFAIRFSSKMWIEILKVVAGKSARAFRFVTCGTKEITVFKQQYMDDGSDEDEAEEQPALNESAEKAGTRQLKGFAVPVVDHSRAFEENMQKSEKQRRMKMAVESESLDSYAGDNRSRPSIELPQGQLSSSDQLEDFKSCQNRLDHTRQESDINLYSNNVTQLDQLLPDGNDQVLPPQLLAGYSSAQVKSLVAEQLQSDSQSQSNNLESSDEKYASSVLQQNFEYQEEIEFRDEKKLKSNDVIVNQRAESSRKNGHKDKVKIKDDEKSKKSMKKLFSEMKAIPDDDGQKLAGRGKKSVIKAAGVTIAVNDCDDVMERTKEASQNMTRSRPQSALKTTPSFTHKAKNTVEDSNRSSQQSKNIFNKQRSTSQSKSARRSHSRPTPTREQIEKKPRLLFSKKREPTNSARSRPDSRGDVGGRFDAVTHQQRNAETGEAPINGETDRKRSRSSRRGADSNRSNRAKPQQHKSAFSFKENQSELDDDNLGDDGKFKKKISQAHNSGAAQAKVDNDDDDIFDDEGDIDFSDDAEGKAAVSGIRGQTNRDIQHQQVKLKEDISAADFISDEEGGAAISGIRGITERTIQQQPQQDKDDEADEEAQEIIENNFSLRKKRRLRKKKAKDGAQSGRQGSNNARDQSLASKPGDLRNKLSNKFSTRLALHKENTKLQDERRQYMESSSD